jgi:transposase
VPAELVVSRILTEAGRITIRADPRGAWALCPMCQQRSRRIHSRYDRRLADLPWQGQAVAIVVTVRRFRCGKSPCERKIFVERLSEVATAHARRSLRLAEIQRHIGMALGGAAGGRLARRLALPVSGDTLLRLVRRGVSVQPMSAPTVIGIDDFAWKRGQRYGTVICDLERRRVIDLLPDRHPATVEAWLARHPDINVVARDRGAGYGHAVARACPKATQVADRWHLMENASAAFLQAVRQSMRSIRRALAAGTVDPDLLTSAERRQYEGFLRREADNAVIERAARAGMSIKEIVRRTGHSRKVVRDVVRGGRTDVFRVRTSSLEPFLVRLGAEWTAGCRNGAELFRRLRSAGYAGSPRVVAEWAARRRRTEAAPTEAPIAPPSARSIARLMTIARDQVSGTDAVTVTVIEQAVPQLVTGRDLLDRFQQMIRSKAGCALETWIRDATNSLLASFARGITADRQAVAAAIVEPWSNGQTEGHITKLKMIKRQMYGRANPNLLHARLCAT